MFPKRMFPQAYFPGGYFPPVTGTTPVVPPTPTYGGRVRSLRKPEEFDSDDDFLMMLIE